MEKRIIINDNRILVYNINNDFVPFYSIAEYFLINGKLEKSYQLSLWDDYEFNGYSIDKAAKKLSYEFDLEHPLYFYFFNLLNNDEKLIIDDDRTKDIEKKYMLIYKVNNKIKLEFINELNQETQNINSEKFKVFIKNIGPDCRSKIDNQYKDTKERLYIFFDEIFKNLEQKQLLKK